MSTSAPTLGKEKPSQFVMDLQSIRDRARRHVEEGALTSGYQADRDTVLNLLNDALATEWVCVLRYKAHYFVAQGIDAEAVKAEFKQHAMEEEAHADRIAERIVQLGGVPELAPDGLARRSHADYAVGPDLKTMIKEDLIAERIAIESYTEMIRYLGDRDPTTRRMMEEILAQEEEHAEELSSLLV